MVENVCRSKEGLPRVVKKRQGKVWKWANWFCCKERRGPFKWDGSLSARDC